MTVIGNVANFFLCWLLLRAEIESQQHGTNTDSVLPVDLRMDIESFSLDGKKKKHAALAHTPPVPSYMEGLKDEREDEDGDNDDEEDPDEWDSEEEDDDEPPSKKSKHFRSGIIFTLVN